VEQLERELRSDREVKQQAVVDAEVLKQTVERLEAKLQK
jgi:hypothetical protein